MPLLYGEGEVRAFQRLQQEIIKASNDVSVFAHTDLSNLVASSPIHFADSGCITSKPTLPPYAMNNVGLEMRNATIYNIGTSASSKFLGLRLNCGEHGGERRGNCMLLLSTYDHLSQSTLLCSSRAMVLEGQLGEYIEHIKCLERKFAPAQKNKILGNKHVLITLKSVASFTHEGRTGHDLPPIWQDKQR